MYILFDIGATKMRIGASSDGAVIDNFVKIETPPEFNEAMDAFEDAVHGLTGGEAVSAMVGGSPGPFADRERSALYEPPNLPQWSGKPLKDRLGAIGGAPVYLEKDTAMSALAAATRGEGAEYDNVVYVTVSTGVGGSRVVNGEIDRSCYGYEIGQQIIDLDERELMQAERSTLQDLVSGTAFKERYEENPEEVTDPGIWNEHARLLAYGLHNTVLHWAPEIIVLGGSMMNTPAGIDAAVVKQYLDGILTIYPQTPEVVRTEMGDKSGLYGALAYIATYDV